MLSILFQTPYRKSELIFLFTFMYLFLVFDFFWIFLLIESYLNLNFSWIFVSSFLIDCVYIFVMWLRMK